MSVPKAEQVVAVIAGAPTIGEACRALRASGWASSIAGNRITVNDRVLVRHVDEGAVLAGAPETRWIVYGLGERPAVRIAVAHDRR